MMEWRMWMMTIVTIVICERCDGAAYKYGNATDILAMEGVRLIRWYVSLIPFSGSKQ